MTTTDNTEMNSTHAVEKKTAVTKKTARKKTTKSKQKVTRAVAAKTKALSPEQAPLLSAEDILKALKLSRASNSIELKLTIPAAGHRATIKSLKLDPVEAQPRQAFFFDTPNLDLFKAGVVVRVRRIQGGRADTVIKLRPIDPENMGADVRHSGSFKIELDLMPGGFVCSASFKGACTGKEVLEVTAGDKLLSTLFSKEQLAFYTEHAPAHIALDSLSVLGPIFLLKAKHQPKDFDERITVEMWLYPDGTRILEISTKCEPENVFQAGADFKAYLARCNIPISALQEPKTRAALEFFTAHPD